MSSSRRMWRSVVTAGVLALAACAPEPASPKSPRAFALTGGPPPQAAGYQLVFADDFDSLKLSPDGTGSYDWYNPGVWWESPAPSSNITASSSTLNLEWTSGQTPCDTSIATASPNGSPALAWRYGYFETRMRWDTVVGAWPAVWLRPVQEFSGASETGEIDIFEGLGD